MIESEAKPYKRDYKKNWLFIGGVVAGLTIIYLFFKRDFYLYTCEQEKNAPACFVLSGIYEEDGESAKSRKYLELSCQNKYEIACTKLHAAKAGPIVK